MAGKLNSDGKKYLESSEIPVNGEYDVIVLGGGPAGIGAALSAARHGMKVLLVENYGFLGGMWTMGMVNPLFDHENKGGICKEIVDSINALKMADWIGPDKWVFDIETMKILLDRMLLDAGVKLMFHTIFTDVIAEGNVIKGVIVENKGGRSAYLGKVIIDCTGDGDAAARAGVPFEIGHPNTGMTQPMTLMFRMSNLDYVQDYYHYRHQGDNELIHIIDRALERAGIKDYKFNYRKPCVLRMPGTHTAVCQSTHVRRKLSIDPEDLTVAEIEGRQLVQELFKLLKTYLPQFKDAQLDATGPHIGIGESRRITGEYMLTIEDVLEGRQFDDGITTVTFWVDIHQANGVTQDSHKKYKMKPYQIPYRCLVPLNIENLLVAGRCISGTFEAHASYRVTGNCVAMGQAAGTAAYLAITEGKVPRSLDGKKVVAVMEADGAICRP